MLRPEIIAGLVVTVVVVSAAALFAAFGGDGEMGGCKERCGKHRSLETWLRPHGAASRLPPGRVHFEAKSYWQEVLPEHVCPPGLQYQMDFETGKNYARLA
eukprot:RCo031941